MRRRDGASMSKNTSFSPRIYVASLADYNAGNLHGVWIDADQDPDAIHEEIRAMLRASKYPNVMVDCPDCEGDQVHTNTEGEETPCATCNGAGKVPSAEEWAIHDYEDFGGMKISEFESIDRVSELAKGLEEHGEAFALYIANFDQDGTEETFQDVYQGSAQSEEEYAEQLYSDMYGRDVTEGPLWNYIDWERVAHDLGYDGYHFERGEGGDVHVFRNC